MSRDTPRHDEPSNGGHKTDRHSSKSKSGPHSKISLNELKRRSAAFLDFIAKTQVELASEDITEFKPTPEDTEQQDKRNGTPQIQINGGSSSAVVNSEEPAASPASQASTSKGFKELNCVEMMDLLTRDLVKWQNRYTS
jgi:hypothetical protein